MKVYATVELPIGIDRLAALDRAHPGALVIQSSGHLILADAEYVDAWNCWCWTCLDATRTPGAYRAMTFVTCPTCGDKNCAHADDHESPCPQERVR